MTEKELSRYFHLKKEIEDLEERIEKIGNGVGSIKIKDMPGGSHKIISIQEKIVELKEKWINARLSAIEEYLKIENYIKSVEDLEIKQIMRYRFMDLMNWEQIGNIMGYERTTISKKARDYIKNSHNSH